MNSAEAIEAALRNPAQSCVIEAYDIGPQNTARPYAVELRQLIPFGEHPRPWVLVTIEAGEREVQAYEWLRQAETDLAEALDDLTERYNDAFGEVADDDED